MVSGGKGHGGLNQQLVQQQQEIVSRKNENVQVCRMERFPMI